MKKLLLLLSILLLFCSSSLAITKIFNFDFQITDASVYFTKAGITEMDLHSGDILELRICSPGGSVASSINLYDYLVDLRSRGVHIKAVATGVCASGATTVLQAATERVITRYTMFLVHKAYNPEDKWYNNVWYKLFPNRDLDYVNNRLYMLYSDHTGRSLEQVKLDLSYDHWMTAEEVVEKGYADRII